MADPPAHVSSGTSGQKLRGGGTGTQAPQPPPSSFVPPPRVKKDGPGPDAVAAQWGPVEELDDRQRHDINLLGQQEQLEERKRQKAQKKKKQFGDDDVSLDESVKELLARFCGDTANAKPSVSQLKQALSAMANHVDEAERKASACEKSLAEAENRLASESDARREVEAQRSQSAQRVEELELISLEFQAEREQWKQRELDLAEHLRQGRTVETQGQSVISARDTRIKELEKLLKEAIVRGAKLGRARGAAESLNADLELRMQKIKDSARVKLRRERRQLEGAHDAALRRAERAEDRLAEFLQASVEGADAVIEAHMQHLAAAGRRLALKVEEQAEIIEVLRGLLQDHKDFIRNGMGAELGPPAELSQSTDQSAGALGTQPQVATAPGPTKLLTQRMQSRDQSRDESEYRGAGPTKLLMQKLQSRDQSRDESESRAAALGIHHKTSEGTSSEDDDAVDHEHM